MQLTYMRIVVMLLRIMKPGKVEVYMIDYFDVTKYNGVKRGNEGWVDDERVLGA